MTITHANRQGKTYYLHRGKSSKGNPRYQFTQRGEGDLVDEIPPGYEIYENPNGQVFLRRSPTQIITSDEVAAVKTGLQAHSRLTHFLIDVRKDAILVHTPDQDVDALLELLSDLAGVTPDKVQGKIESVLTYSPILRFVLVDKAARQFQAYRINFFSDFDDWVPIGTPGTLPVLVREYAPHLEDDSYFELD